MRRRAEAIVIVLAVLFATWAFGAVDLRSDKEKELHKVEH